MSTVVTLLLYLAAVVAISFILSALAPEPSPHKPTRAERINSLSGAGECAPASYVDPAGC